MHFTSRVFAPLRMREVKIKFNRLPQGLVQNFIAVLIVILSFCCNAQICNSRSPNLRHTIEKKFNREPHGVKYYDFPVSVKAYFILSKLRALDLFANEVGAEIQIEQGSVN